MTKRHATTVYRKIGALLVFICCVVHVIGFSVSRWATVKFSFHVYYYSGLWQHCRCEVYDRGDCACKFRSGDPVWFRIVQIMETLGLIGLIISGITTLVLICYKQTMAMKKINLILILVSGVCIVIGLILFGVEMTKTMNIKVVLGILEDVDIQSPHEHLSTSFILCAVAAGISLFICLPLFGIDHRTSMSQAQQQATVYFSNQGQSLDPIVGQGIVGTTGQPYMGNRPTYTYGQMEAPQAYTPQADAGQYETPFPHQTDVIPYKPQATIPYYINKY